METISLAEMTNRLKHDRADRPEDTPGARLGGHLASEAMTHRMVESVRETVNPTPTLHAPPADKREKTDLPIRDPEQHKLTPPGFSLGLGPTMSGMLIGTKTTHQAFLDYRVAKDAHDKEAREPATPAQTITLERPAMPIISDMRPTLPTTSSRLMPTRLERHDHNHDNDENRGR
jgi:hypothetical protein